MIWKADSECDAGIGLRRTDVPVSELGIEASDYRIECCCVRIGEDSRRFELRSTVLVNQGCRYAIEDDTGKWNPRASDRNLIRGSCVRESAHFGESGLKFSGTEHRRRRQAQLTSRREKERPGTKSPAHYWRATAYPIACPRW